MRTFPSLRKRIPSELVTGGLVHVMAGAFGIGSPVSGELIQPLQGPGLYHFHEGDLFNPGTGNYVFDPPFELPLQTIWGNAFLRTPNTFNPLQPPQIMAPPHAFENGIGGLIAGQLALQPLSENNG